MKQENIRYIHKYLKIIYYRNIKINEIKFLNLVWKKIR